MLTKSLLSMGLCAMAVAAGALPAALIATKPAHCKKPYCTSFCPDGTPFNCCVNYVRDPCADHQKPFAYPPLKPCTGVDDFDCQCRCTKYPKITYFCNVRYFRDPCEPVETGVAASSA